MLSTRDPPPNKGTYRLKVKVWKKTFHAIGDQKKAGVAVLISDKIDFEIKTMLRDKERLHDDQRINSRRRCNNYKDIKINAPNIGAPQYVRQILTSIKGKITVTQ